MRNLMLGLLGVTLCLGCVPEKPEPLFSGRVEQFYFLDEHGEVSGFSRLDRGSTGTSTMVKEDVYLEVHKEWVVVKLLNRKAASYIVPRERVRLISVGTKEGNELNIPK